jgi:hypothetical protein
VSFIQQFVAVLFVENKLGSVLKNLNSPKGEFKFCVIISLGIFFKFSSDFT